MKIIEPKTGDYKFAKFEITELLTLERAIQTADRHLSIEDVNYTEGYINVGITYNEGEPNQWTDREFLHVNVNGDSVAAAFKDVYTAAYERCMY